uniref:Uncharacterized protein n=1 Tax=Candidatus Kentrum sp. FW TaxID=2126338 RepID=A0A450THY9_9GAMM|nr:MAG: hypothetical protein BECKFW1821B_GA0114236_11227 [Candidatus Kentron sp. FW]
MTDRVHSGIGDRFPPEWVIDLLRNTQSNGHPKLSDDQPLLVGAVETGTRFNDWMMDVEAILPLPPRRIAADPQPRESPKSRTNTEISPLFQFVPWIINSLSWLKTFTKNNK